MDALTKEPPVDMKSVALATVSAQALHRSLAIVCSIVSTTRPQAAKPKKRCSGPDPVPVLGCVLMEAAPETGLTLSSTNLEQRLTTRVPNVTPTAIHTAVLDHPRRLMAWLGGLPRDAAVDVWPFGNGMRFSTQAEELILPIYGKPADFPTTPGMPERGATFSVDPGYVGDVLDRVGDAMSVEETRYYLNGIFLQVVEGRLVATATDGHRLISIARNLPQDPAAAFTEADLAKGAIVPREAIYLWCRLLRHATTIRMAEGRYFAVTDGLTTLSTKLIDGTYPDYAKVVVPVLTGKKWCAALPRQPLADHLRRWARALGRERNTKLRVDPCRDRMAFEVKFGGGNGTDIRLCSHLSAVVVGKDEDISTFYLNTDYLRAGIASVRGAAVELGVNDPGSPIQIRDPGDPNLTVILMPMRG